MADWHENYSATGAPLAAAGLVIAGTAGGDGGARGFIAAYDPQTGKEIWRFWTTPAPGEPGAKTWDGPAILHPGAVAWMTGSYDPELETLYWTTGNPGSDLNGDVQKGDNLYPDSLLALDVHTGRLKWYYQFTPHDLWDWDAQAAARAHRCAVGGAATPFDPRLRAPRACREAEARRAGEPQRLLLRARSHQRQAPPRASASPRS